MATVVVYDPADPQVANKVTEHNPSAHAPNYDSEPNKLVNPDIGTLWTSGGGYIVPLKYWKYDGVGDIVEMSSGEKAIIDKTYESSKSGHDENTIGTGQVTYQNIITFTFDCTAGTYRVSYCGEASNNGNKALVDVRVTVDGTVVGNYNTMPDAATFMGWATFSGWCDIDLTEAVHTIEMDFRSSVLNNIVEVRRCSLEIA